MKMDPFIEAEEVAGHSVKACCDMFEVSRAAHYQAQAADPLRPGSRVRPRAPWSRSATSTTTPTAPTVRPGCIASCWPGGWSAGGAGCGD